ncbi:MAG: hypothetical protein QM744_12180 [Mesorhizobium sp.]
MSGDLDADLPMQHPAKLLYQQGVEEQQRLAEASTERKYKRDNTSRADRNWSYARHLDRASTAGASMSRVVNAAMRDQQRHSIDNNSNSI